MRAMANEVAALQTAAARKTGRPHIPKSQPDASTSGMIGASRRVAKYIPANQSNAPAIPAPRNRAAATDVQ